jgi:hypothetical protein
MSKLLAIIAALGLLIVSVSTPAFAQKKHVSKQVR